MGLIGEITYVCRVEYCVAVRKMRKWKKYGSSLDILFTEKSKVEDNKYSMLPLVQKKGNENVCFYVFIFD